MKKTLFLVLLLHITITFQAQTIISPNIDFEDKLQTHVLRTHSGDQYIGNIISIHNDTIDFRMRSLNNVLHLPFSKVSFIGITGESIISFQEELGISQRKIRRKSIPMPTNQLTYTATALPYRANGVYRNTMLFVNQVEKQPNKHFSYSIGSLIPALISIKLQGKLPLSEFIHASIVLHEHVILFAPIFVTHPYGVFTLGEYDKYLNIAFGYWMHYEPNSFFGGENRMNAPTFSLGGSYTFTNGWRFFTETLVIIDKFDRYILPSLSFSKYKGRSMFEIGLFALPESIIPLIPIVSYYYAF